MLKDKYGTINQFAECTVDGQEISTNIAGTFDVKVTLPTEVEYLMGIEMGAVVISDAADGQLDIKGSYDNSVKTVEMDDEILVYFDTELVVMNKEKGQARIYSSINDIVDKLLA